MSAKRSFSVSVLALGLAASNVAVLADAASAQERPAYGQPHGGKPGPAPAVKPAPRIATPAPRFVHPPQVARPAPPQVRHVAPPVVRHAAPAPQQHREAPRRHGNWRPWGYGAAAAAAGAVIIARSSRSALQRCADRFASFDWDDGTIESEDGDRELCPYLE